MEYIVEHRNTMSHEQLTECLKVRVPPSMKLAVEQKAGARMLKPADIVREALQVYLGKSHQAASAAPQQEAEVAA
jgi:hypothetical protein